MTAENDAFELAGQTYNSRLIVGTGKYADFEQTRDAIERSGAEIVTVAVRRVNITDPANPTRTSSWGAEELFDPGVGDESTDVGRVLALTVAVADRNSSDRAEPIEKAQAVLKELLQNPEHQIDALTTVGANPMEEIARVARLHRCQSVLVGLGEISEVSHGTPVEWLLGELDSDIVVVALQHFLPTAIAHLAGNRGRTHDVGEQHREKDSFRCRGRLISGQKSLDLVEEFHRFAPVAIKLVDKRHDGRVA